MKRFHKNYFAVLMSIVLLVAAVAVTSGTGGERLAPEAIIELAREGRNREAISAFEALPVDARESVHLLTAVADSYWRERDFESAQALYNEILKQRPTLQGIMPDDQPAGSGGVPVPVMRNASAAEPGGSKAGAEEKGASPIAAASDVVAKQEEKGALPVAAVPVATTEASGDTLAAGVDAMLAQLRREYLDIQELARQRETQLQARFEAKQAAAEATMNTQMAQHQAREQALAAQVSGLEKTVETMRVEFEKERGLMQAQVDLLSKNVIPPGKDGEPLSRLMVMAGYYRDQQDYATASELYKQVLEEQPDNVDAKRKLITTLFNMQRYDEALDQLADGKLPQNPQEK